MAALVYIESPDASLEVADAITRDRFAAFVQIVVMGAGLLTIGVSYSARMRRDHIGEYYALLVTAGAGMAFLVQASNLMTLFLGLEWFSVCLYVLCAIEIDVESSLEAGLKYLIIGGMGSAVLLFGSALVYGSTGELGFSAIAQSTREQQPGRRSAPARRARDDHRRARVQGLGRAVPHVDARRLRGRADTGHRLHGRGDQSGRARRRAAPADGRVPSPTTTLWTIAIAVLACISLAWGNIAALVQANVKRLLAYSSISHAGFMLIAISANNSLGGRALLYYLIPYSAISVGAFAVVAARERELGEPVTLANLAGFGWERPLLGFSMATFMLGFAGFPLTGGFMGKFLIFSAASEAGWNWLVIVGVVATLVSLYYYLAVIRSMYMRPAAELGLAPVGGSPPREIMLSSAAFLAMVVNVGSFFAVQPLVDFARSAADALPL